MNRRNVLVFVILVIAGMIGVALYAAHTVSRSTWAAPAPGRVAPLASLPPDRAHILFRITALDETHGRVGLRFPDDPEGTVFASPMACDRMHVAGERGICLSARRGVVTTYRALLFDRNFQVLHTLPLAGAPSRARMSPDGRLAAVTVFVTGHSYASANFSTRTSVIDVASGTWVVADMENLEVQRGGAPFKAIDFNFWGVTFSKNGQRLYATLNTGGKSLLVQGEPGSPLLKVVHDDVECPSLSPDNRRIGFKRRIPGSQAGRFTWQLNVLELATGKVTALATEGRNVDDQVEWLNDHELLYALPESPDQVGAASNVWALPIDGKATPRLLLPLASSPAVVRAPGRSYLSARNPPHDKRSLMGVKPQSP